MVRHHLDPAETIAGAITGQHDEILPASTVAGWRRRWRANHNDLVAGVSAALVVFSGVAPSGPAAGSLPELTAALWLAASDRYHTSPSPWQLLNVITGTTWLAERVNSSWVGVGQVPVVGHSP